MPLANKPDKKFMAMFMGLVDGDGYIEIGPRAVASHPMHAI